MFFPLHCRSSWANKVATPPPPTCTFFLPRSHPSQELVSPFSRAKITLRIWSILLGNQEPHLMYLCAVRRKVSCLRCCSLNSIYNFCLTPEKPNQKPQNTAGPRHLMVGGWHRRWQAEGAKVMLLLQQDEKQKQKKRMYIRACQLWIYVGA